MFGLFQNVTISIRKYLVGTFDIFALIIADVVILTVLLLYSYFISTVLRSHLIVLSGAGL